VLLTELPDIVTNETASKSASISEKAMKQVTSAIDNAREYAQAVIKTLTAESSA
jgi:chromosome partitioning protein